MPDLHAAAKRYTADDDQCQMAFIQDAFALADFAASLLDETPIDQAWIESIGFKDTGLRRLDLHPFGPLGNALSWVPWDGEPWHGEVVFNGRRWPCPLNTRGAVRRLLFALQIETKENR